MTTRILALVGSLRAGSFNRQLAEAAVKLAPEGLEVEIYENLAAVPYYNEDLDRPGAIPPSAEALREAVRSADALLIVTPEYNGTVPPAPKNAIDWTSRPHPGEPSARSLSSSSAPPADAMAGHGLTTTPARRPALPARPCSTTSLCRCPARRRGLLTPSRMRRGNHRQAAQRPGCSCLGGPTPTHN